MICNFGAPPEMLDATGSRDVLFSLLERSPCFPRGKQVVRQLVLKQDKDKECAPAAVAACEALRRAPLALLSRAHQAALLLQLCNDVCDLASVREASGRPS